MPKTLFENPFRARLHLQRYPETNDNALQAWDSADELLLKFLSKEDLKGQRILILNDAFGALGCSLLEYQPTSYTDSYLSACALEINSGGESKALSHLKSLTGKYDRVFIKIPKNLSFFEDQLIALTQHLDSESKVIAASRIKYLPKTCFDLLDTIIGKTSTSLAEKKSRLIFCKFEREKKPSPFPVKVKYDAFPNPFSNHSNLFSREKLDIGTRFFLDHLPQSSYRSILDLGCGNGILGIAAKIKNPKAEISFSDESAMAILSAKENYSAYFTDEAKFYWTHCFGSRLGPSFDLVLCNPPFHRENSLDDQTAEQMFRDSYENLQKGGVLRVVGNSHLPYGRLLKSIFGESQIVAKHAKFLIWEATQLFPPTQ